MTNRPIQHQNGIAHLIALLVITTAIGLGVAAVSRSQDTRSFASYMPGGFHLDPKGKSPDQWDDKDKDAARSALSNTPIGSGRPKPSPSPTTPAIQSNQPSNRWWLFW